MMSNLSPEKRSSVYARARRLVPLVGTAGLMAASLNSPVKAQSTPCRPTIVLTDQVSGSFRAEQLVSPNTYRPVSDIATGDGRNNIVIQIDSRATVSQIVMSAGVKRLGVDGIEVRDFTTGAYVRRDKQPLNAKIPCEGARMAINRSQTIPTESPAAKPNEDKKPEIVVVTATPTVTPVVHTPTATATTRVVTATPTETPYVVTATPTPDSGGPSITPKFDFNPWEAARCLIPASLAAAVLSIVLAKAKKP